MVKFFLFKRFHAAMGALVININDTHGSYSEAQNTQKYRLILVYNFKPLYKQSLYCKKQFKFRHFERTEIN